MNWGGPDSQGKKIKDQKGDQNIFQKGNWGHGLNPNLGVYGFRGTKEQNAEIGRVMGKKKVGR